MEMRVIVEVRTCSRKESVENGYNDSARCIFDAVHHEYDSPCADGNGHEGIVQANLLSENVREGSTEDRSPVHDGELWRCIASLGFHGCVRFRGRLLCKRPAWNPHRGVRRQVGDRNLKEIVEGLIIVGCSSNSHAKKNPNITRIELEVVLLM